MDLSGHDPSHVSWCEGVLHDFLYTLSEEISAARKKRRFKFVGMVIVYASMQATSMVNDRVPGWVRRDAIHIRADCRRPSCR